MNTLLSFFMMFFFLFSGYTQNDYPEPAKKNIRLFYIQHSKNHNTVVYDANTKDGIIDSSQPIKVYRIVYTQGGIKKPLSWIEKKFAYRLKLLESKPNLFKFRLVSRKGMYFYLNDDECKGARIYVTVNTHKMYLDKMFIQVKSGTLGINVKVEYILFYGKGYNSGEPIIEKLIIK